MWIECRVSILNKDDTMSIPIIDNLFVEFRWVLRQQGKCMDYSIECNDKRITNKTQDILEEIYYVFRIVMCSFNKNLDSGKCQKSFFQS